MARLGSRRLCWLASDVARCAVASCTGTVYVAADGTVNHEAWGLASAPPVTDRPAIARRMQMQFSGADPQDRMLRMPGCQGARGNLKNNSWD